MIKRLLKTVSVVVLVSCVQAQAALQPQRVIPPTKGHASCITETEWADLHLDDVISYLNKTVTKTGMRGLRTLLTPTADINQITKQQQRLKQLLTDVQLRSRIMQQLRTLAECEADLLSYFDSSSIEPEHQGLYFSSYFQSLNHYQHALDCSFILDCAKAGIGLVSLLLMRGVNESIESRMFELKPKELDVADATAHWAKGYGRSQAVPQEDLKLFIDEQRKRLTATQEEKLIAWSQMNMQLNSLQKLTCDSSSTTDITKESIEKLFQKHNDSEESLFKVILSGIGKGLLAPLRDHDPRTHLFKDPHIQKLYSENVSKGTISFLRTASKITLSEATLGDRFYYWNSIVGLPASIAGFFSAASTITHDVFLVMQGKGYFDYLKQSIGKSRTIAQKVRSSARYIATVRDMALLFSNDPVFADWEITQQLQRVLHPQEMSLELHKLLNLLEDCRNQHEHVYLPGASLLAHRLLHEYASELTDTIAAVGVLDALIGLSSLVEASNDEAPWCFARFTAQESAYLDAHSFWCLLLSKKPVLNDLQIANNTTKVVITGPNGGGKSTVMKSIAFNVILAQSVGVACAKDWEQSIFTNIVTSLDPKEDIARGLSSYMAQKQRMNHLEQALLKQSGPQLVLIDEPYRGTVQQTSEDLLYDFCSSVAHGNALMLLATHFEKPTQLENDLSGSYNN